jgi:hypothetical protein
VRWASTALINGAEPHDHLSVFESSASKLPGFTPFGEASCSLTTMEAIGDRRVRQSMIYGTSLDEA